MWYTIWYNKVSVIVYCVQSVQDLFFLIFWHIVCTYHLSNTGWINSVGSACVEVSCIHLSICVYIAISFSFVNLFLSSLYLFCIVNLSFLISISSVQTKIHKCSHGLLFSLFQTATKQSSSLVESSAMLQDLYPCSACVSSCSVVHIYFDKNNKHGGTTKNQVKGDTIH